MVIYVVFKWILKNRLEDVDRQAKWLSRVFRRVRSLCCFSWCVLMIVSTRTKGAKSHLIHSNKLYFSCYKNWKTVAPSKWNVILCHDCVTCFFIVTDTDGILTHFYIIFKHVVFVYLLCAIYVTTLNLRLVSIQWWDDVGLWIQKDVKVNDPGLI